VRVSEETEEWQAVLNTAMNSSSPGHTCCPNTVP